MLKVDKSHETATFSKNKSKTFIKVGSLFVTVSIFSGLASYYIMPHKNSLKEEDNKNTNNGETIVSVSADFRESMYNQNDIMDFQSYYDDEKEISPGVFAKVDYAITEEKLSEIESLKLDALRNNDFTILEKCPNLKTLFIANAQDLSDKDLEIIGKSKATNIILDINFSRLNFKKKNPNYKILASKNIRLYYVSYNELITYYLYKIFADIPNVDFGFDIEPYQKLDKMFNEWLTELNLDNLSEEEKVISIMQKVFDVLTYDQIVLNAEGSNPLENAATLKTAYYNSNLLSIFLGYNGQDEIEGICANYSAIFAALCYNAGIECYYVYGYVDGGHAWNMVNIDGNYVFMDITSIDSLYENEVENKNSMLNYIKNEIFRSFNDFISSNYDLQTHIEYITEQPIKTVEMYNVGLDGFLTTDINMNINIEESEDLVIDIAKPIFIGLGSGIVAVLIGNNVKKRKDKGR